MKTIISKSIAACGFALAAAALCAAPAAQAVAKKPAKVKPAPEADSAMPGEPETIVAGDTSTEFNCELGNKVTVYYNETDKDHIGLRWKKRLHRLTRVGTTTGAQRFENPAFGLIWIGIPAKAMLLDSKQNRQLANECKNVEQAKPQVNAEAKAEAAAEAKPAPAPAK